MSFPVRRSLRHYCHGWQDRFEAFPIQEDDHLLSVIRYVERDEIPPTGSGIFPSSCGLRDFLIVISTDGGSNAC
jgi:hypothetical protein